MEFATKWMVVEDETGVGGRDAVLRCLARNAGSKEPFIPVRRGMVRDRRLDSFIRLNERWATW